MRGGVEEVAGPGLEEGGTHEVGEEVDGHGGDEAAVADGLTAGESDGFGVDIDLCDGRIWAEEELLLRKGVGHGDPNAAGAAPSGEAEGCVGAPVSGGFAEDYVLCDGLEVGGSDSLTQPFALHLLLVSPPLLYSSSMPERDIPL